jgi:hypothetical protein
VAACMSLGGCRHLLVWLTNEAASGNAAVRCSNGEASRLPVYSQAFVVVNTGYAGACWYGQRLRLFFGLASAHRRPGMRVCSFMGCGITWLFFALGCRA